MRKNVLPITAGVLGSLAFAVSASADFTGFQTEMKGTYDTAGAFGGPDVGLVDVWNLYALFNDPNDSMAGIFALADDPNFGEIIHSSVGIFLTPAYARSRGFDVAKLRARGLIVDPPARARGPNGAPGRR